MGFVYIAIAAVMSWVGSLLSKAGKSSENITLMVIGIILMVASLCVIVYQTF